jgi:hypothetical protein
MAPYLALFQYPQIIRDTTAEWLDSITLSDELVTYNFGNGGKLLFSNDHSYRLMRLEFTALTAFSGPN